MLEIPHMAVCTAAEVDGIFRCIQQHPTRYTQEHRCVSSLHTSYNTVVGDERDDTYHIVYVCMRCSIDIRSSLPKHMSESAVFAVTLMLASVVRFAPLADVILKIE